MINIGLAVAFLRNKLELSQRAAADELGISYVYLNRLENGKVSPTSAMLEKFFEVWGIDIYMLAVCRFADVNRLPLGMRSTSKSLKDAWEKQIDQLIENRKGLQRVKHSKS